MIFAAITGVCSSNPGTTPIPNRSLPFLSLPTLIVALMSFIHRQYAGQEAELAVRDEYVVPSPHREQRVVIPVNGINRAVVQAVIFGRTCRTFANRSRC